MQQLPREAQRSVQHDLRDLTQAHLPILFHAVPRHGGMLVKSMAQLLGTVAPVCFKAHSTVQGVGLIDEDDALLGVDRAMKFMEAAGADFDELRRVEFYTGHEGLLMDYERPLTRIDSRTNLPYNTAAHFLWIGERTRDLDGAHVDYFAAVAALEAQVGEEIWEDEGGER